MILGVYSKEKKELNRQDKYHQHYSCAVDTSHVEWYC